MAKRDRSQLDLFPRAPQRPPEPVGPAPVPEEVHALGAALPSTLYLGTSSWTFPGWKGLVYDREVSGARLSREGLLAYCQHPVLRAAGIDRSFYGPVTAGTFAAYAAQVPEGFRFLVKAHEVCSLARYPLHSRYGEQRGQPNPRFLDAAYARDAVVAPVMEGLKEKAGPLVFQFPPQQLEDLGGLGPFVERLHAFLSALPKGPLYAVEVRNEVLLCEPFAQALADVGVCPVMSLWGRMPPVETQALRTHALKARALVARWMLPPHLTYEEAHARFFPFNRMLDPDVRNREALSRLCVAAARARQPTFVILNNKAEGSAPLSALALAQSVVIRMKSSGEVVP